MKDEEVVKYLKALPISRFIELFYKAVEERTERYQDSGHIYESRLVLGQIRKVTRDDSWQDCDPQLEAWEEALKDGRMYLLAIYNHQYYGNGFVEDIELGQFGHCCGYPTNSYAKNAICPICGGNVYGT